MHKSVKLVDNMVMTGHIKRKLSTLLTSALRSSRAGEPVRVSSKARRLSLGAALCLMGIYMQTLPLNAATLTDHYKLYLHSKLISEKQYKCAIYVGHIESRWKTSAINGNHYGLFQMKNDKVKYMNGFQQIDLWIKYVAHRYHGSACNAMTHLKNKGWQ